MTRPPLPDLPYDPTMDRMETAIVIFVFGLILFLIAESIVKAWRSRKPSVKKRWLDNPPNVDPIDRRDLHQYDDRGVLR